MLMIEKQRRIIAGLLGALVTVAAVAIGEAGELQRQRVEIISTMRQQRVDLHCYNQASGLWDRCRQTPEGWLTDMNGNASEAVLCHPLEPCRVFIAPIVECSEDNQHWHECSVLEKPKSQRLRKP